MDAFAAPNRFRLLRLEGSRYVGCVLWVLNVDTEFKDGMRGEIDCRLGWFTESHDDVSGLPDTRAALTYRSSRWVWL